VERRPSGGLTDPATSAFEASPNDEANLPKDSRAIVCSENGTIRCTFVNDPDGSYVDVTVLGGVLYPFRLKRIWATTTSVDVVVVR
jgi:hypothetical protein